MSIDISFLNQITPDNIDQYLVGTGWKPHRFQQGDRTRLYNSPKVRYAQVEVPVDTQGKWYTQSVDNIVKHLAEIEKRDEEAVFVDLCYPQCEIISYRAISEQTKGGTIPLGIGNDFIEAIIESLQTSLCDIVNPKLVHKRTIYPEIAQLREKAMLAQTERGSYVVKVICPLDAIRGEDNLFDPDPIMRRTTKHLMKTSFDLVSAIDGGRIGEFVDRARQENAAQMISANTCNAISKTQLSEDSSVDLLMRWSPMRKMEEAGIPNNVLITPKHFSEIAEIGCALSPKKDDNTPETEEFIAVVDECRGDYNEQRQREGLVVLEIFSSEGKSLKAKANLSHDFYNVALENHGKAKGHFVKITGKLISKGRSNEIVDIESFCPVKN